MPPRMMTRSTGQPAAESQGGGMGGRAGRDRGRVTEPRRRNVNPTNLLPTILAQVGNHGNNQENIVNENVQGDVRNVIVNNDRRGSTEPATIQKAVQLAGALTDEALRNGFIKKNLEKRGNVGEPSNDRNVRDDNKRTRTGNSFATTANPVGRENTSNVPNCATCNSYHAPGVPCRTCFNCKHPGYFAKDCKVMPRNVNPVNVRNPSPARGACYECRSTDHIRSACERPDEKVRHLRSAKAKEQKLGDFAVVRNFPKCLDCEEKLRCEVKISSEAKRSREVKQSSIEESKDLTSLSLDELIGNLKVYEVIIKNDSEMVKRKREHNRSLALKSQKGNQVMKIVQLLIRSKSSHRRVGPKLSRNYNKKAFVGGSWSDSEEDEEEKTKDEKCLMAKASNDVLSKTDFFSDDQSSLDEKDLNSNYIIDYAK
ncbi:hypothetical protein Tco_0773005 [Tanacetum coccineum]|uniref:CCHC-type domain-containing protein n=1 Tax=Tanacetum coccineum TaxID=301880 RepID=A0ABQ4ZJH8_9ASTR